MFRPLSALVLALTLSGLSTGFRCQAQTDGVLPPGAKAVWDFNKAYRETTATRERVCLNGLWRWQPRGNDTEPVPAGQWGYFKVPGFWPGSAGGWLHQDSQTVYLHPAWKNRPMKEVTAAWYQREIAVPKEWSGRRIALQADCVNSCAFIFVDGKKAGEIRFPGGSAEITSACRPGENQVLSLLVLALPLKESMLSFSDTNTPKETKGKVARRGLCGDVFLVGEPAAARLADVKIDTSVRKGEITFDAGLEALKAEDSYSLSARITEQGRPVVEFAGKPFKPAELTAGRMAFTEKWKPEKLWDTHTPQNTYDLTFSLCDATGKVLDTWPPVRFGFREFWIDGRDFYLNGTRIFLSAVPLDNAEVGAAWSTYAGAKESLLRLMTFGVNFVYTHNYGCVPGAHVSFTEILKAADDTGMLVSFSQPHFGQYDWAAPDADEKNGYARHAEYYVRVAQNHPAVVCYSTSHNSTDDSGGMNPDLMGCNYPVQGAWTLNNRKKAARAEAIITRLDSSRVVYHHSSASFGAVFTHNFFANWVPVQEMSDWFEHWAAKGVKPVFLCEYGVPCTWDWAMYRGWYPSGPPKGERHFGEAGVPWEFCLAEWNAQFLGDQAFRISALEKDDLRFEARKFAAGQLWHRWDYPHALGSRDFSEREPVLAAYWADNLRAFRTWGLSATTLFQHDDFYTPRAGLAQNVRKELKTDWEHLQRPGFSPDYIQKVEGRMDLDYERSDWVATAEAKAVIRNNLPLLAYLAGKPAHFTSKDHIFFPGETVEKQIIVINNSRRPVTGDCAWSFGLPQPLSGTKKVSVETGQQAQVPLSFTLPVALKPGAYKLTAKIKFEPGETQEDEFVIQVIERKPGSKASGKLALFDPLGETSALLKGLGVQFESVDARADLSKYEVFVVGKAALAVGAPAPDIGRVREGLKVLMFEQTTEVLEKRFGFRTAEYGLRQVFGRVPDHPLLAGLKPELLRDWRGEATTIPPRLTKIPDQNYGYVFAWCGLPTTRTFRCGNRGNVASALIEKPARGDFLPIVDGGFSLQYSPLMEYREGQGVVLFCQMDVTGRTERDPAAETLAANLINYISAWRPAPKREPLYAGDPAGRKHLESLGLTVGDFNGGGLKADQVLIAGPGAGPALAGHKDAISIFLKAGGHLLALGWSEPDMASLLPFAVTAKAAEHINAYFEPPGAGTLLAGLGPADVYNRAPRNLPLVTGGAQITGDGVLAVAQESPVVFCQMAPWQFEYSHNYGLKRTFRRASCLVTRLLGNMGVAFATPLLERFKSGAQDSEKRWLAGFYLDVPVELDDPYRAFNW